MICNMLCWLDASASHPGQAESVLMFCPWCAHVLWMHTACMKLLHTCQHDYGCACTVPEGHFMPKCAACTCRYLRLAMPSLYFHTVSACVYRYLIAQRAAKQPTLCTLLTACLCPIYNYVLVFRWGDSGVQLVLATAVYSQCLPLRC